MWTARLYEAERANTCIISNGFAAMGIGVPGAIAAKLAHPEHTAVTVTGDAGFLMNCQEIETALRIGTPIIILIWNDAEYGLIHWHQLRHFGRPSHITFNNPDFVKFAESFGAKGYRVQAADELVPTLKQAITDDTVVIIDCPVDYSENMKLTEKLGEPGLPHMNEPSRVEISDSPDRTAGAALYFEPVGLLRPAGDLSQLHAQEVSGDVPHRGPHRDLQDHHGEEWDSADLFRR